MKAGMFAGVALRQSNILCSPDKYLQYCIKAWHELTEVPMDT